MREWRKQLTAQASPVAVAIPEPVAKAASAATASLWKAAQDVAGEALQAATSTWETERAEMEALRQEMSQAFELQTLESESRIEALNEEINSLQTALKAEAVQWPLGHAYYGGESGLRDSGVSPKSLHP